MEVIIGSFINPTDKLNHLLNLSAEVNRLAC